MRDGRKRALVAANFTKPLSASLSQWCAGGITPPTEGRGILRQEDKNVMRICVCTVKLTHTSLAHSCTARPGNAALNMLVYMNL